MDKQLKKAIDLAKKTDSKIIVFDANYPEDAFALLPLEEYEKIALNKENKPLTSDDLTDKINSDVALWRSQNSELNLESDNDETELEKKARKQWGIPNRVKNGAEAIKE